MVGRELGVAADLETSGSSSCDPTVHIRLGAVNPASDKPMSDGLAVNVSASTGSRSPS